MRVYERFRVVCAAVHGICLMGSERRLADAGILICVLGESLREIMRVYERFRVVCAAVHGICLKGCDWGPTDAGCLVCALDESYCQGFSSLACCSRQNQSIGEVMRRAAKNTEGVTDFLCAALGGRAFCSRQLLWRQSSTGTRHCSIHLPVFTPRYVYKCRAMSTYVYKCRAKKNFWDAFLATYRTVPRRP